MLATSKTWTFDSWDDSWSEPVPHFGGPNRKEEFYRGLMQSIICSLKSVFENVSK